MARILERLETLFNNISPAFGNISLDVVEQPLLPDINLIGTARFARRIGSTIAALEPQNQMLTSEPVAQNALSAKVQFSIQQWFSNWAVPGSSGRYLRSILRIGNEFNILDKMEGENKIIHFMEGLLKSYDKNTNIDLYGSPLVIALEVAGTDEPVSSSGSITVSDYRVEVTSRYPVMNNDILLLQWQSQVISFDEYKVTKAYLKSKTTEEGQEIYRYYVDLENEFDFKTKLLENESALGTGVSYVEIYNSLIYLKAFPAFESRVIPVPFIADKVQLGIFCVDYMSGALYAFEDVLPEYMNIKLKTGAGSYVHGYGSDDTYGTIEKNTSIPNCISTDKILLWDKIKGHINFDRSGFIHLIPDTKGESCIKAEVEPSLSIPSRWTCKFFTDKREDLEDPVQITIQLYPNEETHYVIPYHPNGFEIAIEAINSSVAVVGIITDLTNLPVTAQPGEIYIVDGPTFKGIARLMGQPEFGGYWHKYTPKFGTTYFYNNLYYRFTKADYSETGSWSTVSNGNSIEKIILTTKSQYPIKMASWVLSDYQVKDIEYQLLGHVFGKNWMSTGLILKPMMKSLFNLEGAYGTAKYNNGYVYTWNRSKKAIGAKSWNKGTSVEQVAICGE